MLGFIISYADNFLEWGVIACKVIIAWGLTLFIAAFFLSLLFGFFAIWSEKLAKWLCDLHGFGGCSDE